MTKESNAVYNQRIENDFYVKLRNKLVDMRILLLVHIHKVHEYVFFSCMMVHLELLDYIAH